MKLFTAFPFFGSFSLREFFLAVMLTIPTSSVLADNAIPLDCEIKYSSGKTQIVKIIVSESDGWKISETDFSYRNNKAGYDVETVISRIDGSYSRTALYEGRLDKDLSSDGTCRPGAMPNRRF